MAQLPATVAANACARWQTLVCRYARSLVLADRQNTPAIDGAIYRPNGTSYQLQPSFHLHSTEPAVEMHP